MKFNSLISIPHIAALFAAILFFILNQQVPLFADDYCRISPSFDLSSILHAVFNEYMTWTGRFPVIFLNRTFFSLSNTGLTLFNVINSLFILVACHLVTKIVQPLDQPDKQNKLLYLCLGITFLFLLWFSPHRFGEVVLWKTGAIQYFWGALIALIAIKPVVDLLNDSNQNQPIHSRLLPLYLALCFLGGAWLENLSIAISLVWLCIGLYLKLVRKQQIPTQAVFGLIAWLSGTLMLILAPGNYIRSNSIDDSSHLLDRILPTLSRLIQYASIEILLFLLLFFILNLFRKKGAKAKNMAPALAYAAVGILSILCMVAAPLPSFIGRAAFPYEFFIIIAVLAMFPENLFTSDPHSHSHYQERRKFLLFTSLTLLLAIPLLVNYLSVLSTYRSLSAQAKVRIEIIEIFKNRGQSNNIPLPALQFFDGQSTANGSINYDRYFARDIKTDIHHWTNACYASAHNVNSVRMVIVQSLPD